MILKKYDIKKFTFATVLHHNCVIILLETLNGKYDINNHYTFQNNVILYERPLSEYIHINNDKISIHQVNKLATTEIMDKFLKDAKAYEETLEGKKKLQVKVNEFYCGR